MLHIYTLKTDRHAVINLEKNIKYTVITADCRNNVFVMIKIITKNKKLVGST